MGKLVENKKYSMDGKLVEKQINDYDKKEKTIEKYNQSGKLIKKRMNDRLFQLIKF